jgi:hypothetical protein
MFPANLLIPLAGLVSPRILSVPYDPYGPLEGLMHPMILMILMIPLKAFFLMIQIVSSRA